MMTACIYTDRFCVGLNDIDISHTVTKPTTTTYLIYPIASLVVIKVASLAMIKYDIRGDETFG